MQSADPHRCFDPDKARFPTRVIAQAQVVDLLPVTHAGECISVYCEAMSRGDRFPPVSVLRVGAHYFVTDGHKRWSAYRTLTGADLLVEQWPLHHWLSDQGAQLVKQTRRRVQLLIASRSDPAARAALRRVRIDTIGHWRRIGQSFVVLLSSNDRHHDDGGHRCAMPWQCGPVRRRLRAAGGNTALQGDDSGSSDLADPE